MNRKPISIVMGSDQKKNFTTSIYHHHHHHYNHKVLVLNLIHSFLLLTILYLLWWRHWHQNSLFILVFCRCCCCWRLMNFVAILYENSGFQNRNLKCDEKISFCFFFFLFLLIHNFHKVCFEKKIKRLMNFYCFINCPESFYI